MRRRGGWAAVLIASALAVGALGCARERIGPPPDAPGVSDPPDAIPPDLDVVVRIDLRRMRAALGPGVLERLRLPAGGHASEDKDDARLLADVLERADLVFIAFRPGLALADTDRVVVLEGRFADFDVRRYGGKARWTAGQDLGAAWFRFERSKGAARGAPAQVYVRATDLVVLVSVAEIDSVERAIQGRSVSARLEVPSRGAVSVAARAGSLRRLIAESASAAAELLSRAGLVRGYGDLDATGVQVELEVEFHSEADARDAGKAASVVAAAVAEGDGVAARVARETSVETVGKVVVLRVRLGGDLLADVLQGGGRRDGAGPLDPPTAEP